VKPTSLINNNTPLTPTHRIDPSTRLRRAIQLADPVLVARLIRLHPTLLSNPDFANKSNTSLHLAASTGCVPIIALLIAAGHERHEISRNALQETPLMLAAQNGHVNAARKLVEAFPRSVVMVDARGIDALALCARSGDGESTALIPVLLGLEGEAEGGRSLAASPHSRDADGNTPLHHASAAGNLAALRMLLAAGANPLAKNDYDWTPLAYSQTVAAEVYFKNLVAEFERRKVEGLRVGEERERQRAAGVRLVDEGGLQAKDDVMELAAGRQWSSPGDRGGVVVKDRRPERGLGIEGMR
jgi:ankyrin repeat protein